ncbi:MAG: VOC family protein, partial [Candidatus Latescibacteria bacterium]|nr:VOC family protein [Candidatus Latescibacterota bacterium]
MARFLHTRIRVGDLDRSLNWYNKHLGFVVESRTDKSPAGNHVAHLELPGNEHTLELTWSADYQLKVPADLMHLAIAVPDLIAFCDQLEKAGISIWPGDWR